MSGYQPRADFDQVYFNAERVNDLTWGVSGVGTRITGVSGWHDGVEVRDSRDVNAGCDGETALNSYLAGRTITITGETHAATWEALQQNKRTLAEVFRPGGDEKLLKIPTANNSLTPGVGYGSSQSFQSVLGPVGYWKLDEVSGSIAQDSSGNGFTGTVNGATLGAATALVGQAGYATDFDGTNDSITGSHQALLNPATVTACAWVNVDTTVSFQTIFDTISGNTGYRLAVSSGTPYAAWGTGATTTTLSSTLGTLTTGVWYHIAAVFAAGGVTLYVNGVQAATSATAYAAASSGGWGIGSVRTGGNYLNGRIDEVAVYNGTISASNLLQMVYRGNANAVPELAGYERSTCRVVEPIVFGDLLGPLCQEWQVVLRASDPLVYADVEGSETGATVSNYGSTGQTTKAPAVLKAPITTGTSDVWGVVQTSRSADAVAEIGDVTSWRPSSGTTKANLVVNGFTREAYFEAPIYRARLGFMRPVWYYPLNESAGSTADNLQGDAALDGTINGSPTLNQSGPATDTAAIAFDGVNDSVSRAYVAGMFPTEGTFEAWIRPAAGSGYNAVVDLTGGTLTSGLRLSIGATTGNFGLELGDGSNIVTVYSGISTGPGSVTGDTWYHFAVVWTPTTISVYKNGALLLQRSFSVVWPTSGTMYLGRNNAGGSWFTGRMCGVGMHSVAFTAERIEEFYNNASAFAVCKFGAGAYIQRIGQWPVLDADYGNALTGTALTYYKQGAFDAATGFVTTYRNARL